MNNLEKAKEPAENPVLIIPPITSQFEQIKKELCDVYCKYPEIYNTEHYEGQMIEEVCSKCPLCRL